MASHTPGPWIAHVDDDLWVESSVKNDPVICDLMPRDADAFTDEDEANAVLIAAAPALLEAVERAIAVETSVTQGQERERREGYLDLLRAARAKAVQS